MENIKKQTLEEWKNEGFELFGKDFKEWKFVCPACGKINTVKEFIELGADGNDAYQTCLGRHNNKKDGCDWAAFGLFKTLGKGKIVINNGKKINVFNFAKGGEE